MLALTSDLTQKFQTLLAQAGIPINQRPYYHKWLRYYLYFCHKYHLEPSEKRHLPTFDEKLRSKNQSKMQRQQARQAIALYYKGIIGHQFDDQEPRNEALLKTNLQKGNTQLNQTTLLTKEVQHILPDYAANKQNVAANIKESNTSIPYNEKRSDKEADSNSSKLSNANWTWVYDNLNSAIKVRHYSPKTLQAYKTWTHKFQTFTKSKDARLLTMDDVKGFLSFLAVEKKVAASSQNQAFNALLFLFKHVLEKEFGKAEGVVRAKRRAYIPVVLSRNEVDRIIKHLEYPYDLVVKLLYGCGLRLFECLKLRIQDVNIEMKVLTIHDGKGQKDRTLPLPMALLSDLEAQRASVMR